MLLAATFSVSARAAQLSTPERTLDHYIKSLISKDYHGIKESTTYGNDFKITETIKIETYKIVQKEKLQDGSMRLVVVQEEDDGQHTYTYLLQHIKGIWKIIDHEEWGIDSE